jgi:hypothetical protein
LGKQRSYFVGQHRRRPLRDLPPPQDFQAAPHLQGRRARLHHGDQRDVGARAVRSGRPPCAVVVAFRGALLRVLS